MRTVERLFTGAPEVSEAIYRLAQAAREQRTGAEEIRLSPSLERAAGIRLVPGARAAAAAPGRAAGGLVDASPTSPTSASGRRTSSRSCSTRSTISTMRRRASCRSIPEGAIVYLNATLATWLDYDLAQVGSGGLTLSDVVPRNVVAMMTSFSGAPGDVRTETFDLDLRRRNGQFLPVRLYHRVAFGQDGRPGPSRTLVLNRSPGLDVDEGQRAAEVRFARFFNNTPVAIATVNRAGRVVQTNAPFTRLFGTLPRAGRRRRGSADRQRLPDRPAAAARSGAEGGSREPERHPAARTARRRRGRALGAGLDHPGERRRRRRATSARSSTPSTPPICASCRSSSPSRRR